jgi:hydrogenase expression/formation protein HypE
MTTSLDFKLSCPRPIEGESIKLSHGGGGSVMHKLIESRILPAFDTGALGVRHDSAVLEVGGARIAFTTDSFVIRPLFFPGGDIGSLAVNGTVNDLAMSGATPKWLSCGLILEEGFPIEDLERILQSMRAAADAAGVSFVTGDTKVVDKGKGDGVFINTAGIGIVEHDLAIAPGSVRPGDRILLSGDLGRHTIAIMSAREGLTFEGGVESDCASLAVPALALVREGIDVHCMRDLTRGGLASALVEISEASQTRIAIDEDSIPVREDVNGACEILGFDPLYLANEGRFAAFVPEHQAERALEILRREIRDAEPSIIGRVEEGSQRVTLRTTIGTGRIIDMLSGEQLPRIC